jgi:spermidine/putrescine transport system ATP-binding protein
MQGLDLDIERVAVRFGATVALSDVSVSIKAGEFFSFLGPSGCGKSTLLRVVAGFVEPEHGCVRLGGRDLAGVGPDKRPTAMIFQSLALFPLMTVEENISFPLEIKGLSATIRSKRVNELLELVSLPELARRRVHELSGGQKQRVAIARALAAEPKILLLDEPLSALDLKLRQSMRSELRRIQQSLGLTFIYITHDQGEAFAMSDRIAVMQAGRVEQIGPPRTVYDSPSSSFVAQFVGEANQLIGRIGRYDERFVQVETPLGLVLAKKPIGQATILDVGKLVTLFVRPEAVEAARANFSDINVFSMTVINEEFEGQTTIVHLLDRQRAPWRLSVPSLGRIIHRPGVVLPICFDPDQVMVFPAEASSDVV